MNNNNSQATISDVFRSCEIVREMQRKRGDEPVLCFRGNIGDLVKAMGVHIADEYQSGKIYGVYFEQFGDYVFIGDKEKIRKLLRPTVEDFNAERRRSFLDYI